MDKQCLHNFDDALNTNFVFKFTKCPQLTYNIQSVTFPSVTIGEIHTPWQNHKGYFPDNVLEYDSLVVNFLVAENFADYDYIFKRMKECQTPNEDTIRENFDDLHVFRLDSNKEPIFDIVFKDAFCTNLGSLDYMSNVSDADGLFCVATFRYQTFEIINL